MKRKRRNNQTGRFANLRSALVVAGVIGLGLGTVVGLASPSVADIPSQEEIDASNEKEEAGGYDPNPGGYETSEPSGAEERERARRAQVSRPADDNRSGLSGTMTFPDGRVYDLADPDVRMNDDGSMTGPYVYDPNEDIRLQDDSHQDPEEESRELCSQSCLDALEASPIKLTMRSNEQQYAKKSTCTSASSDPDGDGWGWENNASCKMPTSGDSSGTNWCQSRDSDPDGDGWGWENNTSCKVR